VVRARTWLVTIPCTEAEAAAAWLEGVTLAAHERDDGSWRLEAYLDDRPGPELLAALAALAPSAGTAPAITELPDRDWVRYSQGQLTPVTVGRFHVYSAAHAHTLPPGKLGLRVEAGRAFGTGHHATTTGCLAAIDRLARGRTARIARVLDLGTGTGVLAMAAAKRWRRARIVASDIDSVAVAVARGNLKANGLRGGRRGGMVDALVADGPRHSRLRGRFDLVLANILAGPLVAMAGAVRAGLAPRGRLVLAGLLERQAPRVARAYLARGLRLEAWPRRVAWPVLILRRVSGRA
jgi:ribosomal protein L11 methyltransferase